MSSIPRAIATDQVRRLLDGIDQCRAPGRRDYAILLLLALLGLRSCGVVSLELEVVSLELDDIDWNEENSAFEARAASATTYPCLRE
jgi:integrase/recombinase XerD